ncbi:MAG TPA: hypothetical protein VGE09_11315 [Pseudoxanthomonas sp.]
MADGLSLREFGRQLDVTAEAVRKAIASGKIPADCVGEKVVGKGKVWPVITDPARAAEHWRGARDDNQVRDKASLAAGAKRGWAQRRGEDPPDEDEPDDEPGPAAASTGSKVDKGPSAADYRRITEGYKARTAKLDYEERLGKLVSADVIAIFQVNLLTALRNRLRGVPSEAKTRIPHLTIVEIEVLEQLIDDALTETADEDED